MSDTAITEIRTEDSLCFDPECQGVAEPESDGELSWYNCTLCGSEFGYVKIPTPNVEGVGACQLGIAAPLREALNGISEKAFAQVAAAENDASVPVTLGRKS